MAISGPDWHFEDFHQGRRFRGVRAAVWRWCKPLQFLIGSLAGVDDLGGGRISRPILDCLFPYRLPPTVIVGIALGRKEEPWGFSAVG
jgi:uncharacterized membrane protein YfcA